MKLVLKPAEIPFKVGDIIFVNQPHPDAPAEVAHRNLFFEAQILRIFLAPSLSHLSIISERKEQHQLEITTIIYDLKPVGTYADLARVPLEINIEADLIEIFASQHELEAYNS